MSSIRSEKKAADNKSVARQLTLAKVREIIIALQQDATFQHGVADLIKWHDETKPSKSYTSEEEKKRAILFFSPAFIELFERFKARKNTTEDRLKLIDLLDKQYHYLLLYLDEHEQRKNRHLSDSTDVLEKTQRYANVFGIATGEVSSVTFSILRFIEWAEKNQLLNLVINKLRPLLGPFSYFFYGWVSLVYCYKKIKHLSRERLPGNESFLPQRFLISDTLSAGANLLVFIMYMTVAVIYASSLLLTIPWLASVALLGLAVASQWAMAIAAVGTFIGWLGNEVINAWRAKKELKELIDLNLFFSNVNDLNQIKATKKAQYREAEDQRNRGIFMVAGMTFLALSGLIVSPIVPFIPFEISAFTAATIVCMTVYASKVILGILESIGKCVACIAQTLCCCFVGNDEEDKQPQPRALVSTHSVIQSISPAAGARPVEHKGPPAVLSAAEGGGVDQQLPALLVLPLPQQRSPQAQASSLNPSRP